MVVVSSINVVVEAFVVVFASIFVCIKSDSLHSLIIMEVNMISVNAIIQQANRYTITWCYRLTVNQHDIRQSTIQSNIFVVIGEPEIKRIQEVLGSPIAPFSSSSQRCGLGIYCIREICLRQTPS